MRLNRPVVSMFAAIPLLLCLIGCEEKPAPAATTPTGGGTGQGALRIAVVPKGTTHDFWKSVHAGAIKAEREVNQAGLATVSMTFRGPEKEDDREQQISLVQNLIEGGYDAIVLAPLDDKALVAPVRQAAAAGVPVVIIDSGLEAQAGADYVSFVATDNEQGGRLAGDKMVDLLAGTGTVLILRYMEGSASTALREQGFLAEVTKSPGITVIDPMRYAGATRATAQEAAENLLAASTAIDGVYCPNESSTYGMLLALRSKGLAGKVKFVGFDSSEDLVMGLAAGDIHALVVQNPIRMGYLGVMTAVRHLRGETQEQRIDTGVAIITKETMDTPESREVLSPDLDALLGTR